MLTVCGKNFHNITSDFSAYVHIYNHLLDQGVRAVDTDETCRYRGVDTGASYYDSDGFISEIVEDGTSCAVGCLIDDGVYDRIDIEGKAVNAKLFIPDGDGYRHSTQADEEPSSMAVLEAVKNSNPDWNVTYKSIIMLANLQKVHDTIDSNLWPVIFRSGSFEHGMFFIQDYTKTTEFTNTLNGALHSLLSSVVTKDQMDNFYGERINPTVLLEETV